jgi:hypothetical protein
MNGPELSFDAGTGRVVVAFMTSYANTVHWALHDPASATPGGYFSASAGSPTGEGDERYATAVTNGASDVLMVGPLGRVTVLQQGRVWREAGEELRLRYFSCSFLKRRCTAPIYSWQVWNVGPMAVSGTALVKYALYSTSGSVIPGSNVTIGTSFAGASTSEEWPLATSQPPPLHCRNARDRFCGGRRSLLHRHYSSVMSVCVWGGGAGQLSLPCRAVQNTKLHWHHRHGAVTVTVRSPYSGRASDAAFWRPRDSSLYTVCLTVPPTP